MFSGKIKHVHRQEDNIIMAATVPILNVETQLKTYIKPNIKPIFPTKFQQGFHGTRQNDTKIIVKTI